MPVWAIAGFLIFFFIPILNASNQAIWQAKVAPDVQGKVFTVRRLIAQITAPIGMISAGLLTEGVFEPAMMPDGALAPLLGGILGTGAGAGIGLLLVITGLLAALSGEARLAPLTLAVGPEGGFSETELQALEKGGFEAVRLAGWVLRTELAAVSALAVVAAYDS